ncbi:hypothetical protein B9Z55_012430 [Caenorhabditis nigoni]|uniref:DUF19 domain-containing protein n=1 Tax=Caenorhabditis nigoni TaxID=1611254 RepID=A0A2G5TX54_9PELO|nr:hypothetical protein B9Z55_012430 [Caenorhabditis nigoni]
MRVIFLLLLLIPLVNSAPTVLESAPTDCNVEKFKAKMCWQRTFREIEYKCKKAGRFIIYTDKNYTNCFIENIRKAPKCTSADLETFDQVVKSNEDFFKAQDLFIENLKQFGTNIQGCILDIAYERHEFKCQDEEKNKERREPEFMNCMIRRVKKAGKCSPSDLKQFEKILKELDEFKKQIGHKEQYELENGKDDDNLVNY